jgi:hypothetical protein
MCDEGPTFQCFIIRKQKWSNMDVRNFVSCHFFYVDGQIDLSLLIVLIEFYCVLCEQTIGTTTMFVATLTWGSWPKQGLARLQAKRKPKSEGKCEGMNPHTPKRTSTLGVRSSEFR